jgi:hypothetical protein
MPLALTLDGDAAVELGSEVSRRDACRWYTWWGGAHVAGGTRATSTCASVQLKVVAIYEMVC